ncbi:MAG: 5-formyltetrahydrofolate cyclo-ligase [Chitinophagaceae bacterium]|nr:5-formyltetrahydrofolate cyclo-ligase [Chitinophagaceae bacterium]
MTKRELRQLYKARRGELAGPQRLRFDDLMQLQFQQFDYSGIGTLLTYWPMSSNAEPNTHLFSGYLRHMLPGLVIAYPKTDRQQYSINALAIHEETIYLTNEWGITEPTEGEPVDPEEIDLVFVPMLVCDVQGNRVGYGKGFYDRYLARCREDVLKIGFSYFEPVEQITDTAEFDIPLTYCITPSATYEF